MNMRTMFLSGKVLFCAALVGIVIAVTLFSGQADTRLESGKEAWLQPDITLANQSGGAQTTPVSLPGIEQKQDGFEFDAQMKLQLKAISESYAEQAKYPSFSVPIVTDELSTKYLPDMPIATELPADMRNPDGPGLSILPGKFRYFNGDDLTATAWIRGLAVDETSDVSARLLRQGKAFSSAVVSPSAERPHEYYLEFDPVALGDIEWKENITMEVEFHLPAGTYTRSVTVEYLKTIAQIDDTAPSEVQGAYLHIPVYVATEKPGFHRLQANLYDANSAKPLVHLSAEDQLLSNSGMLTLKAHIAALKEAGSEGPYQLKDLMLRRLPSEPDYITEFGRIEQKAFDVEGFPFSRYEDQPYVNEKAERIANELRKLGS